MHPSNDRERESSLPEKDKEKTNEKAVNKDSVDNRDRL